MATSTVPEGCRAGTFEGPDTVTALAQYDTGTEHELSPARKHFTLGSAPDRDIAIDSPFVSAHHCQLDRKLHGLHVTDQRSKNGTYFESAREKAFYLHPGRTFVVGALPHRLLALNDEMRACYPALIDVLGDIPGNIPGEPEERALRRETPSPGDMIVAAVDGAHLLIQSEPHCEQDQLARIIHRISRLRARPIVELAREQVPVDRAKQHGFIQRRAAKSTLVLDLGSNDTRLPTSFVSAVFAARYQIRVIALVRSLDVADAALGEYARQMKYVRLLPIARRPAAIDRLLDRMLVERGSPLRMSQVTPANRHALQTYGWPDNFASLREAADRLTAITRAGSINGAAIALGIPRATLHHWYSKILGLSPPLVPSPGAA